MNQELMEKVLRCPTLPTLPAVAVEVIELTHRPNVSIEELARTIQNDQALTAKILKTVNSSFYGLRRPCGSIIQALVMLGLATVKSLALGFSLISSIGTKGQGGFDYVSYWRRGLYTGVAAKCVAREAGVVQEDEAFLGGLLQDVGMVALHQALGDEYLAVIARCGGDHGGLVKHELSLLEVQHPSVGATLAQRWKLPDELILPVRYHECPTAAPHEHAALVRCVGLGNVAHDVLTDADPVPALARFRARAAEWFELDEAVADGLISRIAEGTQQVAPLFQLNTGVVPDAMVILERARERLAALAVAAAAQPAHGDPLAELLTDSQEYDPLTGVLVRASLEEQAQKVFEVHAANGRPIAAVSLRIDGFADLVARLGTEAGDAVLVETAGLCEAMLGPRGAVIGRSGEAMFTALAPGLDRAAAARAAGGLRLSVEAQSGGWTVSGRAPQRVTVSVGVASAEPGPTVFARASQLMLAAERAVDAAAAAGGGNCVRTFLPRQAA